MNSKKKENKIINSYDIQSYEEGDKEEEKENNKEEDEKEEEKEEEK